VKPCLIHVPITKMGLPVTVTWSLKLVNLSEPVTSAEGIFRLSWRCETMSDETTKNSENIRLHLMQRVRGLDVDIQIQINLIEGANRTIKNAHEKQLNLTVERQALLERAIDFGYEVE